VLPRCLLSFAIASCALCACEERFSANPPPIAPGSLPPVSSSSAMDALFPATTPDAGGAARDSSHALTVTLCSSSAQPCPVSEADDASYRVVFGSGRGVIRSRGQAMADVYKELRDRTSSGERLDAEPHAPNASGPRVPTGTGSTRKPGASGDDPLSQCAFQLLDLVDGVGEVTIDVVHGSSGCRVSLGRAADGGVSRCLVQEPERERRFGK